MNGGLPTILIAVIVGSVMAAGPSAQQAPPPETADPLHRPFDQVLDLYVRDGFVYYRALKLERARLDRYVASLDVPGATYLEWPRDKQAAFWINAYNAFVLQSVINHYPISGGSHLYPAESLRQIPGAFERSRHRAAGRAVTLDEIEKSILPTFRDPRMYLALGRGAVGSGRLRSETYSTARLESQLSQQTGEFLRRDDHIRIDRNARTIEVSPIVGWHEVEFVAAYASAAGERFLQRSPIERAVIALIEPSLLPREREFLKQGEFRIAYQDFDWRLNDLGKR